jgi:hypothetical protein
VSRLHPCPKCGCVRFLRGPDGPPQQKCHECGHVFTPGGEGGESAASAQTLSSDTRRARGAAQPTAPDAPRAGVLTAGGLLLPGRRFLELMPGDGPAVLAAASRMRLRQVWVGSAAMAAMGLPDALSLPQGGDAPLYGSAVAHPWVDHVRAAGWTCDPGGLAGWVGFRRPEGTWVDLVFPRYDERNPFRAARSSASLLGALDLFARHLGLRYRHSPGSTGTALMADLDVFTREPLGRAPAPALEPGTADRVAPWVRDPGPDGWLHAFDVNGMYLAACSDELGHGEARQHPAAVVGGKVQSWPGYWRATLHGGDDRFPLPFKVDGKHHWYTTAALQLAAEVGVKVKLTDVWTYPGHRRALRPWYERIRDARTALMAEPVSVEAQLALAALKSTYTQALGWLGGSWLDADDPRFRPDWREAIIARARANLVRHMLRVERVTGQLPVIAARDDLVVYWSSFADPFVAAAQLGIGPLSAQLGKFKHAGTVAARDFHRVLVEAGPRAKRRAVDLVLDQLEEATAA